MHRKVEAAAMLCELCEMEEAASFHHFIPRTLHANKWFKKRFTRAEMRQGIRLCKMCHAAVHDLIPVEKDLGRHYNTREKLLAQPQLGEYVRWKRQRKPPLRPRSATAPPRGGSADRPAR